MKEKSIAERYPYLFKLEPEDIPWYESNGFKNGQVNSNIELEKVAKVFAMNTIGNFKYDETIEDCVDNFKEGAGWYVNNRTKLQSLSKDKYENAVVIAQVLYAKEVCNNTFEDPDDEWTLSDALDYIYSVRSFFLSGVEWAEKQTETKPMKQSK